MLPRDGAVLSLRQLQPISARAQACLLPAAGGTEFRCALFRLDSAAFYHDWRADSPSVAGALFHRDSCPDRCNIDQFRKAVEDSDQSAQGRSQEAQELQVCACAYACICALFCLCLSLCLCPFLFVSVPVPVSIYECVFALLGVPCALWCLCLVLPVPVPAPAPFGPCACACARQYL